MMSCKYTHSYYYMVIGYTFARVMLIMVFILGGQAEHEWTKSCLHHLQYVL